MASMSLHLYLIVVLGDFILLHLWDAWILNEYSSSPILFNDICFEEGSGIVSSEYATPLVLFNNVSFNGTFAFN